MNKFGNICEVTGAPASSRRVRVAFQELAGWKQRSSFGNYFPPEDSHE